MTGIKEKIRQDLKESLKNREELKTSVLRMFFAALINREKEKRYRISRENPDFKEEELQEKSFLNEEETAGVLRSEAKKRKEAALEYEKGGRKELAEKEKKELKILEEYLPEQLSEEELRKIAEKAVEKTGAERLKDMGKVMAEIMKETKGKADGSRAISIVKEILSEN
jgi:uncharacterized protein